MMKSVLGVAALLAVGAALQTQPAQAQSWSAFEGCWRATGEGGGQIVCVLPGDDALSARIVTLSGDAVAEETVLRADGVARPVEEGGCVGVEKAFFSADGRRVYTRAELECAARPRISTGVMGMLSETEWIDAQAITVAAQHAARSVRYRAIDRAELPAAIAARLPTDRHLEREVARLDAAAPLDVPAVLEGSQLLAAPALEELVAARGHGFDLNARGLISLKDQGVASSTIDLMVALSYPQRFAVRERAAEDPLRPLGAGAYTMGSGVRQCYDPFWGWRTSVTGSCFGYGSAYDAYGYRRTGYSPWGYDGYGWVSRPTFVIVSPREEERGGSVVRGEGYTRGTGGAARPAAPRGPASTSGPSSTPSTSASPSPPPSASPGASSGGSGSSEPRTAKPRGSD